MRGNTLSVNAARGPVDDGGASRLAASLRVEQRAQLGIQRVRVDDRFGRQGPADLRGGRLAVGTVHHEDYRGESVQVIGASHGTDLAGREEPADRGSAESLADDRAVEIGRASCRERVLRLV